MALLDLTNSAQNLFRDVFGDGLLNDVGSVLSENPQAEYPGVWNIVETIYNNVMVPIALGLMVIWFLTKFIEKSTLEQVTIEQALLLFVKLLIAKFLIDFGLELFTHMWSLGISLVRDFVKPTGSEETIYYTFEEIKVAIGFHVEFFETVEGASGANPLDTMLAGLKEAMGNNSFTEAEIRALWKTHVSSDYAGLVDAAFVKTVIPPKDVMKAWKEFTGVEWGTKMGWDSVGIFIQLLVPWLVTLILRGCAYFVAYSRIIEMFLRMCGAPIALSDFMNEGMQGGGWRYLKNFMAVCLQGLLIMIIVRIYGLVIYDVIVGKSGWELIISHLAIGFAAISLMFKSLSLSKELMGTA